MPSQPSIEGTETGSCRSTPFTNLSRFPLRTGSRAERKHCHMQIFGFNECTEYSRTGMRPPKLISKIKQWSIVGPYEKKMLHESLVRMILFSSTDRRCSRRLI